jgi:hypothetical protein
MQNSKLWNKKLVVRLLDWKLANKKVNRSMLLDAKLKIMEEKVYCSFLSKKITDAQNMLQGRKEK